SCPPWRKGVKFKLDRKLILKSLVLFVLIAAIMMGAVELLFLIDLGGLDFAVTFLLVYFAAIRETITYKYRAFKSEISELIQYFAALYLFQPKVFVSHASASGVLVALSCSVLLACLLWIPLIYVSSGFMG
ncbi:MAG: hypothetical protein RLN82_10485, partial [Pseudomonadales bacterium]